MEPCLTPWRAAQNLNITSNCADYYVMNTPLNWALLSDVMPWFLGSTPPGRSRTHLNLTFFCNRDALRFYNMWCVRTWH